MTIQKKWSSMYANEKFICIQTCSGLRGAASDPDGKLFFLNPEANPDEIGRALQDALSVSRTLAPEEVGPFFDLEIIEKRYEDWVDLMMKKFEYSSRKALFKKMSHCQVECVDGVIYIRPMFHEKLEAWSAKGVEKADHVVIEDSASSYAVGQGALVALSRCINR
ncbi:contact-dependent growth inhibition system immunity protein [Cupriavidus sp. 30B13]|uniref:contact-dependent growth inhibition system immunity protein n=1 Tax=Cupriavidus sp. 30B13 TaxID=3384241 RepID=UPI003B90F24E